MKKLLLSSAMALACGGAALAETHRPECFAPAPDTSTISYDAKEGPYKLAFVNGFAGNDWRIQAIQSAKAWANRPENAGKIDEFTVVSVGNDSAAQIAATEVSVLKHGAAQIGVDQAGISQRGVGHVGAEQVGLVQPCGIETAAAQRGAAEAGLTQVETAEVGPRQILAGEVGADAVRLVRQPALVTTKDFVYPG